MSQIWLGKGIRWRGRSLPHVRPYRTRRLGPKITAGPCRRPSACSEQHQLGVGRREGAESGSKSPTMGPVGPLVTCRGGTPVLHPTTTNCQPTVANRHQPPTATNHQRTTPSTRGPRPDGPQSGQKWKFSKVVPDPWEGSNGLLGPFSAFLTRFEPVWPIRAPVPPGARVLRP